MSGQSDDAFLKFLFAIGAVVASIAGVFYVSSFLMPYVLFYALPFIVISLTVGFVLWITVQSGESELLDSNSYRPEKQSIPGFDFKVLGVVLPLLVGVTFLVFEAGSTREKFIDPKTNVFKLHLEWPKAHQLFNRVRVNWYQDSIFESLRAKSREVVVYDRSEIGNIFWLALILGGPGFFFWLSRNSEQEESLALMKVVNKKFETREAYLQGLITNQESIVKKRQKPLEDQVESFKIRISELEAENLLLKAKMEFSALAPTVKAVTKAKTSGSGGVLDGEML